MIKTRDKLKLFDEVGYKKEVEVILLCKNFVETEATIVVLT